MCVRISTAPTGGPSERRTNVRCIFVRFAIYNLILVILQAVNRIVYVYARKGMHCNMCNMNKNCNRSSRERERENVRAQGIMNYRKAQRSARNLYSLVEHLSLPPLKRAVSFTDRGPSCFLASAFYGLRRAIAAHLSGRGSCYRGLLR